MQGVDHVETELVNMHGVVKMCNISEKHVKRLVNRGEFPEPMRFGRACRWRVSDLRAFIAAGGNMEVFRKAQAAAKRERRAS